MQHDYDVDCLSAAEIELLEGNVDRMCRWVVGILAFGVVVTVVLGE